jgi:4,5-DOPA dioxygenase extradiol
MAHPTPDHYLPILYAAAAAGRQPDVSFPVEGFEWGDVSMRSVLFG